MAAQLAHDDVDDAVRKIRRNHHRVRRWIDLPATVYSSTPTPDGKFLLANAPSGKLFVIDLSSEKVVGTYTIPEAIGEITVDATSEHAYVSCPQKGTIEVLDIRGGKLEAPAVLTPGVDGLEWIPAVS